MSSSPLPSASPLPCVVQVGFSGSRVLYDPAGLSAEEIDRVDREIEAQLRQHLLGLRTSLGLTDQHFLAGISQIAIGADTLFSRCCGPDGGAGIALQRVFLPQPVDVYLAAIGSAGPDFTPIQQAAARALLERPAVVHVHSVSSADSRAERFTDALHAILATSDLAVCLLRDGATGRAGGSNDFLTFAERTGKPVLKLTVRVVDAHAVVTPEWLRREQFRLPRLPDYIRAVPRPIDWPAGGLPSSLAYATAIKTRFSAEAGGGRKRFERSVQRIVWTHFFATACASFAVALPLVFAHPFVAVLVGLLVAEISLLIWGRRTHDQISHGERAGSLMRTWAEARLAAETARSILGLERIPIYPVHLDLLRIVRQDHFPTLVATLQWLHLHSTRVDASRPHREVAERYRATRIAPQIAFYLDKSHRASRALGFYQRAFTWCWRAGLAATSLKLAEILLEHYAPMPAWFAPLAHSLGPALGVAAVLLPMLAVQSLSVAAAMDYDAIGNEYSKVHDFLVKQNARFDEASSPREVRRLIIETETTLLGEVAQWYVRRAYSSVA